MNVRQTKGASSTNLAICGELGTLEQGLEVTKPGVPHMLQLDQDQRDKQLSVEQHGAFTAASNLTFVLDARPLYVCLLLWDAAAERIHVRLAFTHHDL
jgi:hypothetical protein